MDAATLTKMLGWEQGKLMPVKSMKPGRDGTLSIYTVERSLTPELDALFSKLSPTILVPHAALRKHSPWYLNTLEACLTFLEVKCQKTMCLKGRFF